MVMKRLLYFRTEWYNIYNISLGFLSLLLRPLRGQDDQRNAQTIVQGSVYATCAANIILLQLLLIMMVLMMMVLMMMTTKRMMMIRAQIINGMDKDQIKIHT